MMKTNSTCMHVTKLPLQLNSVLIGIMLSDGSLYKSSTGPLVSIASLEASTRHGSIASLTLSQRFHTRVCERSNCFARSKARRLGGAYAMQVSLQIASLEAGGQRSNCFARSNSTRSQWQAGKSEVENLAKAINTKLNIYTATLLDRKDQWILTIGAKNLDLLRNIVVPHFHPSTVYRVGA